MPPLANLLRRSRSCRTKLLNRNGSDQIADRGRFEGRCAGEKRRDDAARGGVPRADDINRAIDGNSGDQNRRLLRLRDEGSLLPHRAKDRARSSAGQKQSRHGQGLPQGMEWFH